MFSLFRLLSLLALTSTLIANSDGHGFMGSPRTRGAYTSTKIKPDVKVPNGATTDYCAHCQNGGGVGAVRKELEGDFSLYRSDERAHAGLCGDPVGGKAHMVGGEYVPFATAPIVENYAPGAVADFSVQIDTNHNGFFVFYLCNLDACGTKDIDQKCFDNNHCSLLKRVASADCENSSDNYECGPIDVNHPERWYVPCRGGPSNVKGGNKGSMKYKIPDDVQCKHCVVQWYWVTANSCNPQGMKQYFKNTKPFGDSCGGDGGSVGGINPVLEDCGGDKFPEEFWGCADVSVGTGVAPSKTTLIDDPEVNNPNVESANTESQVTKTPTPSPTPTETAKIDDPDTGVQAAQLDPEPAKDTVKDPDPTKTPTPSATPFETPKIEDPQAQERDIAAPKVDESETVQGEKSSPVIIDESVPMKKEMESKTNDKHHVPRMESNERKRTYIIFKKYRVRRGKRKYRIHKRHYYGHHW